MRPLLPKTRGIRCKHHMIWAFPSLFKGKKRTDDDIVQKIFKLSETCTLDVADRGNHTFQEIGDLLMVSKQMARVIIYGERGVGGAFRKVKRKGWIHEEGKELTFG